MEQSSGANKLRKMIDKAIEDNEITHEEYDEIMHIVYEDGHIDAQERALLSTLQDMIESKMVKWSKK